MHKLIAIMMLSVVLVACNTIEGAGKDIKKAGEAVEKAAK
jgi:predicted small secreted protein